MKLLIASLVAALLPSSVPWLTNLDQAQAEATRNNKLNLLNFSGTDWCAPCIRIKKEFLESPLFQTYAAGESMLVQAYFPRQKKNQLGHQLTRQNEALAEKNNREEEFPLTILPDAQSQVLSAWDAFTHESPDDFVSQLNAFTYGQH